MTGGSAEVTAAAVDTAECHLDRRQVGGPRERCSRLECFVRLRILTQPRPQLPDPGMQSPRVGVVQRQGSLKVSDRFAVREDRLCLPCGFEEGIGRLRGPARLALMKCDQRITTDVIPGAARRFEPERVGRSTVEQAPSRQADPVVGRITQDAVAEVEPHWLAGGHRDLADEAAPNESLKGVDRLFLGPATGVAGGGGLE